MGWRPRKLETGRLVGPQGVKAGLELEGGWWEFLLFGKDLTLFLRMADQRECPCVLSCFSRV